MYSTLGLDIGPVRRQRVRWPGFGGLLALAAAALLILLDPPLSTPLLGLLVAAAAVAAWAGWRAGAATESGRLLVDPAGSAAWLADPGEDPARAVPIVARQWQAGTNEIWLLAEDRQRGRMHLRLDRSSCDERQWRAVRRWLVWSGRATSAVRHA